MLVILSGASGSGKDTIKNELLKRDSNITTLPSYTDRPIRATDVAGITYEFVSTQEFENMINNNELYEYSVHHNHYYGTSKVLLNEKLAQNKIIVKDIDVNGTENLEDLLKNDIKIVTIFLRVDKQELRRRLESREDKLDEKEIQLRLNRFDYEESKIGIYDYIIRNYDLEKTVNIVMEVIKNECK
ncbi:MAG: AAA family ATPase [Oscillospiraceae bacterium]|nr:AAA family ATPase [Oscillospiraceae bacterium]